MERPALQGLLADIRAGRIDILVIYKVDRLTQSLANFARWSRSSTHRMPRSCRCAAAQYDERDVGHHTLNLPHSFEFIRFIFHP
jgi:hypothetical protein